MPLLKVSPREDERARDSGPTPEPRHGLPWRRYNNALHRDIGYLVVGLTLVYAISGVALNHVEDFNPNYSIERREWRFDPFEPADRDAATRFLVEGLQLPEPVDVFRSSPTDVQLLYEGWTVRADFVEGRAQVERPRERPLLFDLNSLHSNRARGVWTWIADAYAVLLAFLAVSGLFVLRGRKGLGGRGKWWVGVGVLVPVVFVVVTRYLP